MFLAASFQRRAVSNEWAPSSKMRIWLAITVTSVHALPVAVGKYRHCHDAYPGAFAKRRYRSRSTGLVGRAAGSISLGDAFSSAKAWLTTLLVVACIAIGDQVRATTELLIRVPFRLRNMPPRKKSSRDVPVTAADFA